MQTPQSPVLQRTARLTSEARSGQLLFKGALTFIALELDVPYRVEHFLERTFQVAEDTSIVHAGHSQRDVRADEQVAGLSQTLESYDEGYVIHVPLQKQAGSTLTVAASVAETCRHRK